MARLALYQRHILYDADCERPFDSAGRRIERIGKHEQLIFRLPIVSLLPYAFRNAFAFLCV